MHIQPLGIFENKNNIDFRMELLEHEHGFKKWYTCDLLFIRPSCIFEHTLVISVFSKILGVRISAVRVTDVVVLVTSKINVHYFLRILFLHYLTYIKQSNLTQSYDEQIGLYQNCKIRDYSRSLAQVTK